ncbi:hypothetical protein TeGR_g10170, partial [Tetraparma gracilis]
CPACFRRFHKMTAADFPGNHNCAQDLPCFCGLPSARHKGRCLDRLDASKPQHPAYKGRLAEGKAPAPPNAARKLWTGPPPAPAPAPGAAGAAGATTFASALAPALAGPRPPAAPPAPRRHPLHPDGTFLADVQPRASRVGLTVKFAGLAYTVVGQGKAADKRQLVRLERPNSAIPEVSAPLNGLQLFNAAGKAVPPFGGGDAFDGALDGLAPAGGAGAPPPAAAAAGKKRAAQEGGEGGGKKKAGGGGPPGGDGGGALAEALRDIAAGRLRARTLEGVLEKQSAVVAQLAGKLRALEAAGLAKDARIARLEERAGEHASLLEGQAGAAGDVEGRVAKLERGAEQDRIERSLRVSKPRLQLSSKGGGGAGGGPTSG